MSQFGMLGAEVGSVWDGGCRYGSATSDGGDNEQRIMT